LSITPITLVTSEESAIVLAKEGIILYTDIGLQVHFVSTMVKGVT